MKHGDGQFAVHQRVLEWLAGGLCLGMALVAYVRLFIGVDFTDEAFYSALPHSFANGFRPYWDEINITQNGGILLTPLYWLFERVTGGTQGIILFNRHLFFAMLAGCAWLAGRVGRAFAGVMAGRLLAAFVFTFSYFNIPALSYNTLGALALFIGVFLMLWQAAPSATRGPAVLIGWANLSFVVAAFAYPTLLLASVAGVACAWWRACRIRDEGDARGVRAWVFTACLACACVLVFLWFVGLTQIQVVLGYAASYGYASEGSGRRAFYLVLRQGSQMLWFWAVMGLWLALPLMPARWLGRQSRVWLFLACGIGAWAPLVLARHPMTGVFPAGSTPVVLALGFWLPFVVWRLDAQRLRLDIGVIAGVPTTIAAVSVAWGSLNGLPASTIGLFTAAAVVVLVVLCVARDADAASGDSRPLRGAVVCCLMAAMLGFLGRALLIKNYRDDVRLMGSDLVLASGPYAGIFTTAERARMVASLDEDFKAMGVGRTLLVLDDFPAGYLFSDLRPAAWSSWLFWSGDEQKDRERLRALLSSGNPAVDWVLRSGSDRAWMDSELERAGYRTHLRRDELGYRFYASKMPSTR